MAFAYLAAASVGCALIAVTRRNPVHSVLWVLALFFHIGGIYLMAAAQFLAAMQIIIYAGAILVFYLIILMLLDWKVEGASRRSGIRWFSGAAAGLGFIIVTANGVRSSFVIPAKAGIQIQDLPPWQPTMTEIGLKLFKDYPVHFEVASLILLAAIIGAIVLAKSVKHVEPSSEDVR